jgi:hypothetical protein
LDVCLFLDDCRDGSADLLDALAPALPFRLTVARGGRDAVPAKITSSMPAPRIDLALLSPITQRMASNRLDLPQPFGPTMPVSPLSIRSSAGSTKLLKPTSFSFFIRKGRTPLRQ